MGRTISRITVVGLAVFGLAIFGLIAAGCGGSAANRHIDSTEESLIQLPDDWEVYSNAEVANPPFVHASDSVSFPVISQMAFAAGGLANAGAFSEPVAASAFPIGVTTVRDIPLNVRDLVSRRVLSDVVLPYQGLPSQELVKKDFAFDDTWNGIEVAVMYTDPITSSDGAAYFISITDPGVSRHYSIAIGCSLDCFADNQADIEQVINSWLVDTR